MKVEGSTGERHRQATAMAPDKDDEDVRPEVRRDESWGDPEPIMRAFAGFGCRCKPVDGVRE